MKSGVQLKEYLVKSDPTLLEQLFCSNVVVWPEQRHVRAEPEPLLPVGWRALVWVKQGERALGLFPGFGNAGDVSSTYTE